MRFRRYESVEFVIPASFTGNSIFFKDIPLLRSDVEKDIIIQSVRIYPAEVVPLAPSGNTIATLVNLQSLFLNLYVHGENSINQIPLVDLVNHYQSANTTAAMWVSRTEEFQDIQVDWTKSFVQFAAPLGNVGNLSLLFGITYQYQYPGTQNARRAVAANSQFGDQF